MNAASPLTGGVELWGGVECTVNRVGDEYFDQLELSGHAARVADLNLFATLGLSAMRYPILWERIAPFDLQDADWSWADERLERLRELGIEPIVGLVHHGSGPRHTSLITADFPEKLAAYARAVAMRYPWITNYTPVNEPLTTARFSGLYGHWYPHGRDDRTFVRALLVQCRAIVLAMRAIREVNPQARLVQTEDLGKTFSTRKLAYQADLENERRWLSFDLLTGRVNSGHPLWDYLCQQVAAPHELEWFAQNTCPPDIIGINHYLTSERFLDERIERYPSSTHGGNAQHVYADVEAVRVCAEGTAGMRKLLLEAWERYNLPVAVTEAHLGCTREEQLRWFKEVWEAAQGLQLEGVDVRAVTAWALLGSYNWNSLVTRADGHYESGVYDLRGSFPRPTALAKMLPLLARGETHEHPVVDAPGWWRRLERLIYPPVHRSHKSVKEVREVNLRGASSRTILITGATGTLGKAFARLCEVRGLSYRLLSRREMDIADRTSIEKAVTEYAPWAIINAAGYVRVDDAESDAEKCFRENAEGAALLAGVCAEHGVSLVTFSSDLVFDGQAQRPYLESDAVAPVNVYGRSKVEAEQRVLAQHPTALVIRTSAFFGPWDEYNFVTVALKNLSARRSFIAADDALVSPTYVPDLVNASLDLLIDGEGGLWHLANSGAITWADLARLSAKMAGLDERLVEARPSSTLGFVAPRPLYSVLGSERGMLLPSLETSLAKYLRDCKMNWRDTAHTAQIEKKRVKAAAN
jgi:dTDP-4-dehydrorhamnose reductase